MSEFSYLRTVRKYEVDLTGFLNTSNYFRYMEECECALFRSLGLSFFDENDDAVFPRVSAYCEIVFPVKYDDEIVISVVVDKLSRSSLVFDFNFFREKKDGGQQIVARGKLNVVACVYDDVRKRLVSVPIGDKMRSRIVEHMGREEEGVFSE